MTTTFFDFYIFAPQVPNRRNAIKSETKNLEPMILGAPIGGILIIMDWAIYLLAPRRSGPGATKQLTDANPKVVL